MHASRIHTTLLAALLFGAVSPTVRAADVLAQVPGDALGFVVINDLGRLNDKAAKLMESLQLQFPAPLALLKLATGVGDGLNPQGDMLLAILPGAQPSDQPQFGIWLPVSDYKQFVASLNGTPADGNYLKAVEVQLGNGQKLPAHYGPHGMPPTDFFWSLFWTIPGNFPTGSLGYKVNATMQDGSVVTWEPFTRPATQLMVIAGEPTMAPANTKKQ